MEEHCYIRCCNPNSWARSISESLRRYRFFMFLPRLLVTDCVCTTQMIKWANTVLFCSQRRSKTQLWAASYPLLRSNQNPQTTRDCAGKCVLLRVSCNSCCRIWTPEATQRNQTWPSAPCIATTSCGCTQSATSSWLQSMRSSSSESESVGTFASLVGGGGCKSAGFQGATQCLFVQRSKSYAKHAWQAQNKLRKKRVFRLWSQ